MTLRIIAASLLVAMAIAFAPVNRPAFAAATSRTSNAAALQFGFLKELGLEKPSWLPDFGGKTEEETPATEEEITAEGEAAPVEEEE